MDDMVAFIRDRLDARERQLDQDERVASAAYANAWTAEETRHKGEFLIVPDYFPSTAGVARGADNAAHIARFDPQRMLAEVEQGRRAIEAQRRILHLHRGVEADDVPGLSQCRVDSQRQPCETVRLVGLAYAGADGYRPEWAPQHVPTNEVVEYPGDDE